jgi:UDP-N-acetylmuramoyl-tripeptide--D-alanyl-D-alanine ligase
MAAATQLGVGLAEAAAALESFQPLRMRCQAVQTAAGVTILNDSYNANPESTRAALRVLSVWPCEGKRIAVLGDMLELGDFGREAHLQTGREAATLGVDMILAVGDLAEAIAEGAQATEGFKGEVHRCRTKQDAMELLLNAIRPGSVVLVKGSRMTGMDEVVRALQDDSFRAAASGSESSGRAVSY